SSVVLERISQFPISHKRLHGCSGKVKKEAEPFVLSGTVQAKAHIGIGAYRIANRPLIHTIDQTIFIDIFINKVTGKQGPVALSVNIDGVALNLLHALEPAHHFVSPVDIGPSALLVVAVFMPRVSKSGFVSFNNFESGNRAVRPDGKVDASYFPIVSNDPFNAPVGILLQVFGRKPVPHFSWKQNIIPSRRQSGTSSFKCIRL